MVASSVSIARDGTRLWVFDHATVPILSLRGNSAPLIDGGVVYVGEDNGKVIAVRANDGGECGSSRLRPAKAAPKSSACRTSTGRSLSTAASSMPPAIAARPLR